MRHIFIILFIFLSYTVSSAQSYDKMWRNISEYQKKDLPQSVIKEANNIFIKAQKEKNSVQMIKSFLTAMQCREDISADSLEIDIASLERLASESDNVADKALLYTILARVEAYKHPQKSLEYVKKSMNNSSKIVELSDSRYKPIIDNGTFSERYFKNNLLHIIAKNNLRTLERINNSSYQMLKVLQGKTLKDFEETTIVPRFPADYTSEYLIIYQTLLNEYKRTNMMDAWLITAADVVNKLKRYSKSYTDQDAMQNLSELITKYKNNEAVAYVYSLLIERKCDKQDYVGALDMVRMCITKYPKYIGLDYFKNKEKEIKMPYLSAAIDDIYAGVDNQIRINYNNVSSINLKIYKIDSYITPLQLYNNQNLLKDNTKYQTLVRSEKYNLTQHNDFKLHNEEVNICIDKPGIYYVEIENERGLKDGKIVYVTSIMPIIQPVPGNKIKIIALDALKGKPVCNAEFNIYANTGSKYKYELLKSIKGDANGIIIINSNEKIEKYNITSVNDKGMQLTRLYAHSYVNSRDYTKEKVSLFTDRAIYKPSQTVRFSGFAYTQDNDSTKVLPNKEYEAILFDAHNVKISSMNVTTDKYGSFSGDFILPSGSLNGRYRIKVISSNVSFGVEEYKRPSFQVDFLPVEKSFSIGDTVNVKGYAKTYSGLPLKNSLVKWQIRSNILGIYKDRIADGNEETETRTDDNGYFSLPVVIEEQENKFLKYWYRAYNISATVTDNSGESVEKTMTLPYGSSSLIINAEGVKDILLKEESDSLIFKVTNLTGQEIDTPVNVRLYKIESEGKDSVLVLDKEEVSNSKISKKWCDNLSSGKYRLVIQCNDDKGREAQYSNIFVLFSLKDRRTPIKRDFWFYDDKSVFSFGTSLNDADFYFNILSKNKIIESGIYNVSDSIVNIDCKYKKEYGDGVEMNVAFVKNGKMFSYSKEIIKPYLTKKLCLKWKTFRDKLQPGNNEEWKLRITYPDGRPANAQIMSTMYDASLDAIYNHGWSFNINYTRDVVRYPYSSINGGHGYFNIFEKTDIRPFELKYSDFNLPYMDGFRRNSLQILFNITSVERDMVPSNRKMMAPVLMKQDMITSGQGENITVRKDFAETAFFYPQLNTDKNGEMKLSFMLPESLTKWHFIGLAHTENVDYGMIESDITVSKDFMVKPSLPRFLRTGDRCLIPVTVTNLKNDDMKGDLIMEMIEPATNKVVFSTEQRFDVDKGETNNYQFEYIVSDNLSLLICRIVGKGKKFSDGEQNYIPVLSDKEMVTKSVPMIMTENGKYNYNISSDKDKKVTLEITANPIWHVIQALPVILTTKDDAAYSWATSLYASMINGYLLSKNPSIRQFSSQYKSAPSRVAKDLFESELQKNQELKEIVLSETPWLTEASNEEKQRKMLAEIGDVNQAEYTKKMAIDHLRELQNEDGSWSWYKKMAGNINITSDILETLIRAKVLCNTATTSDMNRMCQSAFTYLKNEAKKSYQQAVKTEKEGHKIQNVPLWIINYIYISTLDNSLKADDRINRYFIDKLKDNAASLDIYEKSLCAVIFAKMNMRPEASQFLESLTQYTVYTKNMGRYFDTKKARCTYSSNIIPSIVSTIEALQLSNKDNDYAEQMKQWLIVMKGMQSWTTNIATTNAIYALLNDGNITQNYSGNGIMKINTGKEAFKITQNEPLGYLKKEIDNSVKNVNIEKTYPGLSYGAVYIQGLQKVDTLKESSTGLLIKKTLYCKGKIVDNSTVLNLGDVVTVRLELKSPAYMDFVQIKDPLYSCMQPCEQLSSVMWNDGMVYNKQVKNASLNFFIDKLGKGNHVIEYDVYITKKGTFASGLTKVESAYFPMMRSICGCNMIDVR